MTGSQSTMEVHEHQANNETSRDVHYMQRCLALAQQGLGLVAPNPLVGCVIVNEDRIIGEGYHHQFGGPHGEIVAMNQVNDTSLLEKSTLYVNLEPCAHQGKTPPCASAIISAGIQKVVVAQKDPNASVQGGGLQQLRDAGIEVVTGVLEKEALALNKRFNTAHTEGRPYVILKWAQTQDGYIDIKRNAGDGQLPLSITGETSNRLNHLWRTQEQAVLIGQNTALLDNPQLNTRHVSGPSPIRVILDPDLSLPSSLRIFDAQQPTLVLNSQTDKKEGTTEWIKIESQAFTPAGWLEALHQRGIQSVIAEGGAQTIGSFQETELWDEARVFTSRQVIGAGVGAPSLPKTQYQSKPIEEDTLYIFHHSDRYSA